MLRSALHRARAPRLARFASLAPLSRPLSSSGGDGKVGSKRVAVLLSGCGVYDGSEATEAVACLVHLSKAGCEVGCFAPDAPQMHSVNHLTGEEETVNRNCLVEAARLARGAVQPLGELSAAQFDGLVVPGGFGAAKNLSDFAAKGAEMEVEEGVGRVLREFHSSSKPIGLCCIAPVLAAKEIKGVHVTVGMDTRDSLRWPYAGTCAAITAMGATHHNTSDGSAHVDQENKVVTSSAYMENATPYKVFESVGHMVDGVLGLMSK